jgi:glutamate-1-semialdehyde 2,1-aminomutase
MDLVRLVSSGTEATMSAIRLARGFTGRKLIVKFEGCYHGHADALLVKAARARSPSAIPSSAGVPENAGAYVGARLQHTRSAAGSLPEQGKDIAAVIVEPVAGNMNLVLPASGFLEALRENARSTARC